MRFLGAICALQLALGCTGARAEATEPVAIAVLDFDYSDSSGEARDQTAEHRARLVAFAQSIRTALSKSSLYRVVAVRCPTPPCSAQNPSPEDLFAMTRQAGARLLLFGKIHKMSTLVQWGRVELIDVDSDRVVDESDLTFRGDDEAWRRAADFVARKIITKK